MRELIYDGDVKGLIQAKYPQAKIRDASDDIHIGRFEVLIEDVSQDDFWIFAIRKGFAMSCLAWRILMQDDAETCKKLIRKAGIK
jgi:hypothetical protein